MWWYRPVPAIRTFLNQNDLSGKTIKPFATNTGWIGRTFKKNSLSFMLLQSKNCNKKQDSEV